MARHESEMHRQQRELREVLRNIITAYDRSLSTGMWMTILGNEIAVARTLLKLQPPCDEGLFGDRRQLDLADRKDLTDRSK